MKQSEHWVKLWSKLLDSGIWTDCPDSWLKVWINILLTVKYQPWHTATGREMPSGSRTLTIRGLAEECRVSVMQVRATLDYLQNTTMIEVFTAQNRTHLTVLNWHSYQSHPKSGNTRATHEQHTSNTKSPDYNKEVDDRRKTKETSSSPCGDLFDLTPVEVPPAPYTPEFEEFWALYPWKRGKQGAAKVYALERKTVTQAAIVDGLRRQLPDLAAQGYGFRLHPMTWLRQGRYADEADIQKRGQDRLRDL